MCISTRNYKFDNLKFLLMFFVITGHLLEFSLNSEITRYLYTVIYSFHMPTFIFISGYFAKFNFSSLLKKFIIPYFYFQSFWIIYYLIAFNTLKSYLSPEWVLWYLFVIIIYYFSIPIINTKSKTKKILIFILSIILSLGAGFVDFLGYFLSLQRMFYFYPFFVLGFYLGKSKKFNTHINCLNNLNNCKIFINIAIFSVFFLILGIILILDPPISALYGSYSYNMGNFNVLIRIGLMAISFSIILLLVLLIPNKNFPITKLGQNTMPIYILHSFLLKIVPMKPFLFINTNYFIIICFLYAFILMILFGNKIISKFFNNIFM